MIPPAKGSNHDVSVVILSKNSAETIQPCLDSVVAERPREIIAVDAFSTDGTAAILRRYDARLLFDPVSSLGYSRKLGVDAASGNFVMFVDSDVVLVKGCIMRMKRDLQRFGWVGTQARLLNTGNLSYWRRSEDQLFGAEFKRAGPKTRIVTAATLFYRSILLQYPFDVKFEKSCEDMDLCLRLANHNHRVGISGASAYHVGKNSFQAFAKRLFDYGLGDAVFGVKHRVIRKRIVRRLKSMVFQMPRSSIQENLALVPYWCVSALIQFSGFLVGLAKIHESQPFGITLVNGRD
jgi:glycosyltransferase involved in cell wall biosynthesis